MAKQQIVPPPVVAEALAVLGQRVRLGRQERGWSAAELAVRAGVTAPTVRAAEAGRPGTASGTLFTLAWLVGVPLFEIDDPVELARLRRTGERELALLPARVVHRQDVEPDADF